MGEWLQPYRFYSPVLFCGGAGFDFRVGLLAVAGTVWGCDVMFCWISGLGSFVFVV